jgi:hypothetical protein
MLAFQSLRIPPTTQRNKFLCAGNIKQACDSMMPDAKIKQEDAPAVHDEFDNMLCSCAALILKRALPPPHCTVVSDPCARAAVPGVLRCF